MPVATVKFWSFPFGSGSGIAPVFGNTRMPDMTDPDHPVLLETLTKKAVFDDAVTGMIVPRYTGWQKCNVVSFEITGDNPLWYWVSDARRSSDTSESLRYSLSLMAVTSELKIGDTVTGDWSRLPDVTQPLLGQDIPDCFYQTSKTAELPKIAGNVGSEVVAYVQVTTKKRVYNNGSVTKNDGDMLTRYGAIIKYNPLTNTATAVTAAGGTYATLQEITNNPAALFGDGSDLTSNDILDISISERCPWALTISGSSYSINGAGHWSSRTNNQGVGLVIVESANLPSVTSNCYIAITDDEQVQGRLELKDTLGNIVSNVNMIRNLSDYVVVDFLTYSDYGRIYDILMFPDGGTGFIEEGHLPYTGSAWTDYSVAELPYDRQMMQLNVNQQKTAAIQGGIESVLGGMISGALVGGPAGAAAGAVGTSAGLIGTAVTTKRNIEYTRDQQKAKENYVKAQSGGDYNIGYGINYLQKSRLNVGGLKLLMPAADSSVISAIASRRGYPADEYSSQTIGEGFHQGTLTDVPESNRRFIDELCAEIAAGVYIKEM